MMLKCMSYRQTQLPRETFPCLNLFPITLNRMQNGEILWLCKCHDLSQIEGFLNVKCVI
uniref:Uncharacterized protein n=1 Tax=Anguilla anguilla TaxID=7936 RepID=A0A0E9X4S8_ANGAN